ncbi:MAG TPA: ABC transporter ATP-binding protein [Solirubrobacteraceae bacterium]|jgi:putative ABC transport system ATP-binding protein|nr:ABC transporter ATP-binding protein [Solirubrobacteraceae bacterium]
MPANARRSRSPFVRRARHSGAAGRPHDARPRDVIELHDVTKTYATGAVAVQALRGISLTIERGDFVAIMGSSGSGKSTLMNIVGCLDAPTAGRYLIDGVDVAALDEDDLSDLRSRKIGFVFQSFNLVPRTSALANVALPLAYARIPRPERHARAARALIAVGMRDRAHHAPAELSGGQQQRVAIARALVANPALILADEPTGNLDSHATAEVLEIFEHLHDQGRTVVIITHEESVAAHARRVIRLEDGLVTEDQTREPALSAGRV